MFLIDGDIAAYRCAYTTNDSTVSRARNTVDRFLQDYKEVENKFLAMQARLKDKFDKGANNV